MKKNLLYILLFLALTILADAPSESMPHDHSNMEQEHPKTDNHSMHHKVSTVPFTIMEAGTHKAGHFMVTLQHMRMSMDGNSNQGNKLSDQEIISYPNLYKIDEMMPFLSTVPKRMDMEMTMLEAMYGVTDEITFMLMANFINKEMSLNSYSPMGTRDFLRTTTTSNSDLSNLSMSSFIKLKERQNFRMNIGIGFDKSLGNHNTIKNVMTPMNMRMNMTLPYAMQIGDKSTSLLTAFTIVSKGYDFNLGAQVKKKSAVLKKDWNFGDSLDFNIWVSKLVAPKSTLFLRLKYQKINKIEGRDLSINAPVQTANPQYSGGKSTSLSLGQNIQLNHNNSIGLEYSVPLKQDLNGPQMEVKNTFNFAYKLSF